MLPIELSRSPAFSVTGLIAAMLMLGLPGASFVLTLCFGRTAPLDHPDRLATAAVVRDGDPPPPGSVALDTFEDPTPGELASLKAEEEFQRTGRGYSAQQSTRPQTLGYGLTDSPAAQATWIAERCWAWTDHSGHAGDVLSRQQILDEISVYWFTASATSSARLYWEGFRSFRDKVTAPSGLSIYPGDITCPSRREAELRFTDLRWFEEVPQGGHFAAFEQPESLVEQVRGFFRLLR